MKYFFLLLATLIGLILQSTYFEGLKVAGLKPDLVMLIVVFYAVQQGAKKGAFFGFAAGLLEDVFAAKFLGIHAVIKAVIGFAAGMLEKRVYKENIFAPAFVSFLATFVQEAGYIIIRQLAGGLTHNSIPFLKSVGILAGFHMLLAIIGYYFYYFLAEKDVFPRPQRRF